MKIEIASVDPDMEITMKLSEWGMIVDAYYGSGDSKFLEQFMSDVGLAVNEWASGR